MYKMIMVMNNMVLGMRRLLGFVMIANAALFFFGAVQHAGLAIGSFHEPRIIPAAMVETLCGLSLVCGAAAVLIHSRIEWRVALAANLVALGGVLLGIAALAAGRGPRTASNDLYHRTMLVLIGISLLILFFGRSARR
jgi:hypothetical protein